MITARNIRQKPMIAQNDAIAATPREEAMSQVLCALRVIYHSVQLHNTWIERDCCIGGTQLWALHEISESPGIRVSDVAKKLSIHQSTASNLIDKLTNQNWVVKERNNKDQRIVALKLTEEGKAFVKQAPRPAKNIIIDALSRMPDENIQQLETHLNELINLLEVRDEGAGMEPLVQA